MSILKVAARTLAKTPFLTAVAILSLALGIGANAAIFSLFDQLLLQSLPVREPERLVDLRAPGPKWGSVSCGQAGDCDEVFSYPMFRDLQAAETGLSGLAAHNIFGANLAYDGETVSTTGVLVSGSYFPVLGLRPALGRLLGREDDHEVGEGLVAVLAHGYWQNDLGGDPDVLNTDIVVNGHALTVVGVAPPGFAGTTLGAAPDIYVPITLRGQMVPGFDGFENRHSFWAYLFGRLAPGVSAEQATARLNTAYSAIIREVEAPLQGNMSEATMERFLAKQVELTPGERGQSTMHGEVRTPMILLLSITGVVLLIACANIANLLLVRGASRDQEMAIRGSLGASRGQLLRQLLTESLLLAVAGGVASLLVARWILGGLGAFLPESYETVSFGLSVPMLLVAAGLSMATGLLFGLYPALNATRADLATALRAHAGQPSGARGAARFRTVMVVTQLALSMALLVGAGLFIRSLLNVSHVELGMQPESVVTFSLSPELNGYEPERSRALFERVEESLGVLPGVSAVTAGMVPILSGSSWGSNVSVEGFESGPDVDDNSRYDEVGPGYFRTLGIPLLAGREFTAADALETAKVAIVNEAFTTKFGLDGPRAVGKRMAIGSGGELDMEIVGVIQDARYSSVKEDAPPLFYVPYRQDERIGAINFYVRAAGAPEQVSRAIPAVIERFDRDLPVENLRTLVSQVREITFQDRMISALSAAFAVLATLLAAIGLYGVLAYTVAQRTREIGVRIALGADARRVRGMVLRQVLRMLLVGGVIGIAAALALGSAASSLLFGLDGHDPLVLAAVVVLLGGVALGAGYLPAFRASRIDPMRALREE